MTVDPSAGDTCRRYVMVVRCLDRPGIVHEVTRSVLAVGGNIVESAQFTDVESSTFVMRTRFESPVEPSEVLTTTGAALSDAGAVIRVRSEDHRLRTMIMVSRYDHCMLDLLYRHRQGELDLDIPVVVSNHPDVAPFVHASGRRFVHLPITAETKTGQERRLRDVISSHAIELVVLARYMQVLSSTFCAEMPERIINIHHSFLPGFKGAHPYRQARQRGVKLIGATAHYVTADLDEGPIIEQDVIRVDHTHDTESMVRLGRDVERTVLSRAVQAHAQDRVVVIGNRTVVFR